MSNTDHQRVSMCAFCESGNLDDSVDDFEYVCFDCGFAHTEDRDPVVPGFTAESDTADVSSSREWLDHCKIRSATEKRLAQALNILEKICDQFGLQPEVRKATAETYCESFRAETTDGRDTASFMGACLYLTAKLEYDPIPTKRLTGLEIVEPRKFRLSLDAVQDDLDIRAESPGAKAYLPFIVDTLDLSDSQKRASHEILENVADAQSLVGKSPPGIAGAAVYVATDDRTQSEVAKTVGVSTETIRLRASQLRELSNDD